MIPTTLTMHLSHIPFRVRLVAAFAAIYFIWGSTYLANRFAVESMPPFFMAGMRSIIAGVFLYFWERWRGEPQPALHHWKEVMAVSGLLIAGPGAVAWAVQWVASGLASLFYAMLPIWMVLLEWAVFAGGRPGGRVVGGVFLGLVGVALLVNPWRIADGSQVGLLAAVVLILSSISWAAGSLCSLRLQLPFSALLALAMQMIEGGVMIILLGFATGEYARLALSELTLRSTISFGYLTIFGTLLAISVYIWLLTVTTPARATTYVYVNPVVAVFLGWALGNEPLTFRTVLAAFIILTAVVFIATYRAQRKTQREKAPIKNL